MRVPGRKYAAIAAAGFAKNLRHDLFQQVQSFSFTNIDRFSTGSIITRLTTDVTNLQNAYMMIVRTAVRAPVMMIVSGSSRSASARRSRWCSS